MVRSRPPAASTPPAQQQTASPFPPGVRRAPASRVPWDVVAVVSAGGVIGALARYAITSAWPAGAPPGRTRT